MKRIIVLFLAALVLFSAFSACQAKVLVKDKSVVKIGEDINMGEGLLFKDLVAINGNINVKGDVGGDVVAVLGNIHLYPTAKVAGDVTSVGGTVTRNEGAKVHGKVTEVPISKEGKSMIAAYGPMMGMMTVGGFLMLKLMMFISFLIIAIFIVSIFTKNIGSISSRVEKKWLRALLWGIVGYILICPIAGILAVSIVGIPLIVVEAVIVSAALITGYIAVAQLVGKKLLAATRKLNQPMMTEVICGLLLLFIIELIPVVGWIVKWIVVTLGFGSALLTKLGTQK